MCIVSMVFDYGQKTWPDTYPNIPQPTTPYTLPASPNVPSPEQWAEFKELVEKAKKFDELTSQPDCEDPKKQEWYDRMERRLAALEARQEISGLADS